MSNGFRDLERDLSALADDLKEDLTDAEERNLSDPEAEAHRNSAGGVSYREQRRMGHPYARRRVRLNPDIVNQHSREFDRGWETDGPKESREGLTSELWNDSQAAEFFERGTDTMVARHPQERAADAVEEQRFERLERVLDKHLE